MGAKIILDGKEVKGRGDLTEKLLALMCDKKNFSVDQDTITLLDTWVSKKSVIDIQTVEQGLLEILNFCIETDGWVGVMEKDILYIKPLNQLQITDPVCCFITQSIGAVHIFKYKKGTITPRELIKQVSSLVKILEKEEKDYEK